MPETTTEFDLIVIGAGSAGLTLSLSLARAKLRVLLIDRTAAAVGGECLNSGCVPSKALIHAARLVQQARQAGRFGLQVSGTADLGQVMNYIHDCQDDIRTRETPDFLRAQGIAVEIGEAVFVGRREVQVNGRSYRGRKLVIATGSRPRLLAVPGAAQATLHTNENVWSLRQLPARLLVIGGGPNGVEMAQAMQRLGSQVTLVQRGPRLLENEDSSISAALLVRLRAEGIVIYFEAEVSEFTTAHEARVQPKNGVAFPVGFDLGYVALGREVSFEGLQLAEAGVEVDEHGHLRLNDYLQTTNPAIFAAGDAANSLKFSHGAELHARLLLFNFFSPIKRKLSYKHFSWVTFTDPEVAHFGLDEAELRKNGTAYERWETSFAHDDRAVVDDYRDGRLLLFVAKTWLPGRKRRLLGGAMLAPHAGELIQELILANSAGLGTSALFNKVYPYPVAARINQQLVVEHLELPTFLQKVLGLAFRL